MIKTNEIKFISNNKQKTNLKIKDNKINFTGIPNSMADNILKASSEGIRHTIEEMDKIKKLVIINGSPRSDKISNTYKALMAEKEYYKTKYPEMETTYFKLPRDMNGCYNCKTCIPLCVQKGDNFKDIVNSMADATDVMIGSPVYLDMPTPQTVAFLTRLNSMAENTDRKFFANKAIHLVSTAFCSGTKTCIHAMMGACEMLGFTIKGRSTREYIVKWSDKKLRGGLSKNDSIWLE